jgi:hypothetical protein
MSGECNADECNGQPHILQPRHKQQWQYAQSGDDRRRLAREIDAFTALD